MSYLEVEYALDHEETISIVPTGRQRFVGIIFCFLTPNMESPAFEVLKKAKSKYVKIITLNNKVYRGVLENFDMHVNIHLKDSYVKPGEDEETYIGEVLINGGTVACVDIA